MDESETYLELYASNEDANSMDLGADSANPAATMIQSNLLPMASCSMIVQPKIPSTSSVQVKFFISFRTPLTPKARVTDQLPTGTLIAKNVKRPHLQTEKFKRMIALKARQLVRNFYPCSTYQQACLEFELIQPRFGLWMQGEEKFLNVNDISEGSLLQLDSIQHSTSEVPMITASLSFMIHIKPIKALESMVSSNEVTKQAVRGISQAHINQKVPTPEFTAWVDDLSYLASLPSNFETMSKFIKLASEIKETLERPKKAKWLQQRRQQTEKPTKWHRSKPIQRDLREELIHPNVRPSSIFERLGPQRRQKLSRFQDMN